MALIDPTIDANVRYVRVRANNAAEMALRLAQAAAALGAVEIVDFELFGTGAAPNFLAMLTVATEGNNTPSVTPANARFLVVGGIGGINPVPLLSNLASQVIATGGTIVNKMQAAGGGAGPHWMAAALYQPAQG